MASQNFTFRQFAVHQDRCAMKVGTDGVLLGAWANVKGDILDIGTGTGLIALMTAQRSPSSKVTAIEIDRDAAVQATENVASSPFADRISVVLSSIQDYRPAMTFHTIVSNPPFFESSLKNPDPSRATARHTDTLSYRELFQAVARLLADEGEFSAVIPSDCLSPFIAEAYLSGLRPTRQTAVRTTPRKQPKRYLVAFSRQATVSMERSEQCLQNTDGSRSEWYDKLTSEFYIK